MIAAPHEASSWGLTIRRRIGHISRELQHGRSGGDRSDRGTPDELREALESRRPQEKEGPFCEERALVGTVKLTEHKECPESDVAPCHPETFLCRHSVLPFALLRGRTRSLPVGRLAGSQEGRERGLGRHQGAPCAGGGASRPEWEGEGRMAYMPEVRNGLPTCRAVLSGASQHGRRREGRRGGRPGGRGVSCHGRPCCTRLMPIRCPPSRARRRGCPSRGCSAPSRS